MRRLSGKSAVKTCRLTISLPLKLLDLRLDEVCGIRSVAVKCIDITKNTDSVGSIPEQF